MRPAVNKASILSITGSCQPGQCVASNLSCCWQNRDRCTSQTNPYMHARHRSSIKADWFKALKDCSSTIPHPALPLLLPRYQIAVIQDGLNWKGKGMFTVCPANAGNILSHSGRGNISGSFVWALENENELVGLASDVLDIETLYLTRISCCRNIEYLGLVGGLIPCVAISHNSLVQKHINQISLWFSVIIKPTPVRPQMPNKG